MATAIALVFPAACADRAVSGVDPGSGSTHEDQVRARLGRSTLENRYVYAPPDEGTLTVPLSLDMSLPGEYSIQEPAMMAGSAQLVVSYSKSHDTVDFRLSAHGLPYRPTFIKDYDDSTRFNKQPTSVQNARWRLWLIGTTFGRQHEDLYYDNKKAFIGSRFDIQPLGPIPEPQPGYFHLVQGSARQMVGSPTFEPEPNGELQFHFTLPYSHIADAGGTPGAVNMLIPFDGCQPDALSNYWTQTVLPSDKFMTWGTFLESIWSGEGIGFIMTAEPLARSDALPFRESTFVGWGNVYPGLVPESFGLDFRTFGTLLPIRGRSYQLAPWPPTSRRQLCKS